MSGTALDDALAYAAQGLHVHPVHNVRADGSCTCPKGSAPHDGFGKHPWSAHGLSDATTDPETIRELWRGRPAAQVGVNCGASGLVVLDTDVHGDVDGRPTWAALVAEHPALDAAPMAETPHDGWHAFYSQNGERIGCPAPTPDEPDGPLGEGIDVKGIGGYVILPSSVSAGRDWIPGHELDAVPLPELPAAVVKRLTFRTKKPPAAPAEKRAKVREGGRNAYLCDRALAMKRSGFTEAAMAAALQAENLEMCDPPRTAEHVAGIAARYAKLNAKPDGAVADEGPPPERRHVRAYSLPELAAMQPEQVQWVLGDYIAAGDVASLESAPKCGKTTLLRKLHVHIATGTPFLGRAVKQGPSLYCTEERAGTSREGFARAGGLELPDIHVMFLHDFHGMDWTEKVEEIAEHRQRLGAVLVSFDTLSKWAGLKGEEEQSAGVAMEVMGPLQRLAATGCAVDVVRHERKSGGATGEAGRGSSAFAGDLDVILSLRKVTGEKTQRKLGAVGRHDATPDEVVIDYVDGEYSSLGDPHALRRQEQERAVVDLLPVARAAQVGIEELHEKLEGVSRETVRGLLLRLMDEGVVCRAHGEIPGRSRADGFWLRGDDD